MKQKGMILLLLMALTLSGCGAQDKDKAAPDASGGDAGVHHAEITVRDYSAI